MNKVKLNLQEKLGQMILLGIDKYEITDDIINIIKDYKVGGVVLYKKNYTSIESMIEVINKLKSANKGNKVPLFISIDQENGRVNRLPKDINRIYNARRQANTKNISVINACNEITSYLLSSLGVNMNFAPCLDIVRNDKSKAIGDRSYGDNIKDVITYGIPFMKSLQKNNIISVVKHFPGHGATNKDSHIFLPKVYNVKNLKKEDIRVFEAAISSGADAIMVGHLVLKGYGSKPATLNKKIINNLLIKKYNYNGLIVTDELRMNYLSYLYGMKRVIKKSIEAGNNVLMIKYHNNDDKLYKNIYKMLDKLELNIDLINKSADKILSIKNKYHINDDLINPKLNIDLINKKIDEVNNKM